MNNPFEQFMQQAKHMQDAFKKIEEDLKALKVIGEAGAGSVKVTLDGRRRVQSIEVEDEIYKEGKSVLLELIMAAFNDALSKINETTKSKMAQLTSHFGLPANFNFPFGS